MNCIYCETEDSEYLGDDLPIHFKVQHGDENLEVNVFDSPDDECFVLLLESSRFEFRIKINNCPMCGRVLR